MSEQVWKGDFWHETARRLAEVWEASDTVMTPEAERSLLENRAAELARVIDEYQGEEERIVTFTLDEARYGVPLEHAREIVPLFDCTPVPGTPARLLGLFNLRGTILPLFDLRSVVTPSATSSTFRGGALVVVMGRDGPEIAISTDGVGAIQSLRPEDLMRAADTDTTLIRGITMDGVIVIDGEALLDDPRLTLNTPVMALDPG